MEEERLVVNVQNFNKKVGKFRLHDITFALKEGYVMGLVGRMGSGKTSLLKNLIKGDVSDIEIFGGVGVIMEEMPFILDATLKENAQMYGCLYENYSQEIFDEKLAKMGIGSHKVYGLLSKGEKVKFQLAFAISHQPKVLIFDEPTAGLDVSFRREFLRIIQEYVETNMASVIIATHIVEDLYKIADFIGYMEDGSLIRIEENVR